MTIKQLSIVAGLATLLASALACNAPVAAPTATTEPAILTVEPTEALPTIEPTIEEPTVEATEAATEDGSGLVAQPVDVTDQGVVEASTTYDEYPASMSVDGDPTTSWFSTGPDPFGAPTTYSWTGKQDYQITEITILSNEKHIIPEYRENFGFGSVTIQIFNGAGDEVYSETVDLPGTPDPNVRINPDVVGRSILLTLNDTEAIDCGGFAELSVVGVVETSEN